ncbi:hypothetical protein TCAL_10281 [Tigriopus californicus]|uniref:Corticotropin-releasing factor domain-containing protein n=1 Tax=Tigriopus californicus TaxID=6832 RepID=A0A553N886_TIGCA|nr:uncharacterized protein LOC131885028 [Tigriopus californicus]TRY61633.1 hypothetical protein TCAL_10281 [Tigriopus californicus]|eukprot:TCALIF_10281-PA protein Name:"Protein of unknown function" AED:0.00 eAED:0.00 QI:152/1/1/1/1/1/3/104/163
MKRLCLPLIILTTLIPKSHLYGSIRDTQDQLFGKKHTDKIRKLESEANNPTMVRAYSHLFRAILSEKSVRRELGRIFRMGRAAATLKRTNQRLSAQIKARNRLKLPMEDHENLRVKERVQEKQSPKHIVHSIEIGSGEYVVEPSSDDFWDLSQITQPQEELFD